MSCSRIDDVVAFFVDPSYGVTERYDWRLMALRHGIFFQGATRSP
jgi:hypothetical protein